MGDCVEAMAAMPEDSVDAVVTDPPYMLTSVSRNGSPRQNDETKPFGRHKLQSAGGFMGQRWDAPDENTPQGQQVWHERWAREALRVLKPGGHLLAFGGTRTHHRLACAIEDAGFEIRDTIQWIYGSGFPKSSNVSKTLDKMAGAEREKVGPVAVPRRNRNGTNALGGSWQDQPWETKSATDEAKEWDGWGTALKPAHEPIVMARKPLGEGSVAKNVLKHGTGAINVDASRVEGTKPVLAARGDGKEGMFGLGSRSSVKTTGEGRFPANLLISHSEQCLRTGTKKIKAHWSQPTRGEREEDNGYGMHGTGENVGYADPDGTEEVEAWECVDSCPVRLLDEQSGVSNKCLEITNDRDDIRGGNFVNDRGKTRINGNPQVRNYAGQGGASRFFKTFEPDPSPGFFYAAKSSRRERNQGLEGMPEREKKTLGSYRSPSEGRTASKSGSPMSNNHPTVKPLLLMRYLVRMVCPPGGTVLDPFAGSGSTLVAAIQEGFDCVGLEQDESYAEIARARIEHAQAQTEETLFTA